MILMHASQRKQYPNNINERVPQFPSINYDQLSDMDKTKIIQAQLVITQDQEFIIYNNQKYVLESNHFKDNQASTHTNTPNDFHSSLKVPKLPNGRKVRSQSSSDETCGQQ